MVGDIQITSNGDFIRYFKSTSGKVYKKEGMYSPIVQNERYVEVLLKNGFNQISELKIKCNKLRFSYL